MTGCFDCKFIKGNYCNNCKETVRHALKKYGCDRWILNPALDDGREPIGNMPSFHKEQTTEGKQ